MRRPAFAALAALAALVVLPGTAIPAFAQAWPVAPASDNAELISQLFWFTLILATVVFVLVEGLLIYSSLRFRRRAPLPLREPPQIHGNTRLEVMWATVPALLLVGLFGITVTRLGDISQFPTDENTLHVAVTGQQFAWTFQYGDTGVQTTNDLHLPVGQPLIFDVTSKDVIHSFWVPDLYGKIDALPGRINHITFTVRQPGTFRGVCAQLCGSGHAGMLFRVTALSQDDFQQWIQQMQSGQPVTSPTGSGDPTAGRDLIAQQPCGTCHTIPGVTGASGTVGPGLAGVASRTTIAGGAVPNNGPDDLKRWIMNPPGVKPGTTMPNYNLTDDQATQIVAYLETLK
ncbi:MAG: cytochrome c oxidase subunit II [Chloroflexi bacterium]|nr:cytochrome c oxidase subunit II [Chloroflexota bacterium]MBV9547552.1 cytochrome c oxidase subunit II [Chloroflexota bacterium]